MIGSDLQPRPRRHQADGVAGEQPQVLGAQEERRGDQAGRATTRGVGEQQVTAIQRSDGDCAARCQSCEEDRKVGVFRNRGSPMEMSFNICRTKPAS